jgi:hypothetical protein
MIVRCKDGAYYLNPRWANGTTIVSAVGLGVEIWHKTSKPVKYKTLFRAANRLGLGIGVHALNGELGPVEGDMGRMVFAKEGAAGKFVDAFHAECWLSACPAVPTGFDAKLDGRPADGDEEIVDDFGIKAAKARMNDARLGKD